MAGLVIGTCGTYASFPHAMTTEIAIRVFCSNSVLATIAKSMCVQRGGARGAGMARVEHEWEQRTRMKQRPRVDAAWVLLTPMPDATFSADLAAPFRGMAVLLLPALLKRNRLGKPQLEIIIIAIRKIRAAFAPIASRTKIGGDGKPVS